MRDSVTFVHTADLHLDAPFQGIAADDLSVGAELAEATYTAFRRVVDTCLDRQVDFLVIAGDAYNSAERSLRAQLRFQSEMRRLEEAGIEVLLAHGNHDPAGGWTAQVALPENVRVFPTDRVARFEVVRDGEVVAAVYGRSYGRSAETENLSLGYRREGAEPLSIGVLHANVGGDPQYDSYAPASLEDLRVAGMHYWALGHIHKSEVLARDPWVVYAGSPQGLNPKEVGAHGCYVVEATPGGIASVEQVETAPIVWLQEAIDLSGADSIEDVRALVAAACEDARAKAGRPIVARLALVGRSAAHSDLARPGAAADLAQDVRADQVSCSPWLWLDRLEDLTAAPIDLDALRAGGDFASELVVVADRLASDPEELLVWLAEIVAPLASTLTGFELATPPDILLEAARDAALDLLLAQDGGAS